MEHVIITKGHFESPRKIILEEDFPYKCDLFEVIIIPIAKKELKRKAGTLKGLIHLSEDFNKPLDDLKEYTE